MAVHLERLPVAQRSCRELCINAVLCHCSDLYFSLRTQVNAKQQRELHRHVGLYLESKRAVLAIHSSQRDSMYRYLSYDRLFLLMLGAGWEAAAINSCSSMRFFCNTCQV